MSDKIIILSRKEKTLWPHHIHESHLNTELEKDVCVLTREAHVLPGVDGHSALSSKSPITQRLEPWLTFLVHPS